MKKNISLLLIFVLLFSIVPLGNIFAAYPTPRDIKFDSDSNGLQYSMFTTEATAGSGITFRTIGWRILYRANSSNSWRTVNIDVKSDSGLKLSYQLWLTKAGYEKNVDLENESTTERVLTSIETCVPEADKQYYLNTVKNGGGDWQFNAIIQACNGNNPIPGKVADTLEGAIALEPWGSNTIDDFYEWYYKRPGNPDPEPIPSPNFDIYYKSKIATDKTVEKDLNDLTLVLHDKTQDNGSNPITERNWYYWDVTKGWEKISTGTNDKTVNINNMDIDLSSSNLLKKSFKLEVNTQADIPATSPSHFIALSISQGSITTNYIGVEGDTQKELYPPVTENNLPFGSYTRNAKAAPTGYSLLGSSSITVTISSSKPHEDIYFYYQKDAANKGTIVAKYKDKLSNGDIMPPDTYNYDYGTYSIDAKTAPPLYTLASASPQQVTLDATHKYVEVIFLYQPDPSISNRPPIAIPTAPTPVYAGEEFNIYGSASDPDGDAIVSYEWDLGNVEIVPAGGLKINADGSITGQSGKIWYPDAEGYQNLTLTVTDSKGAKGSDSIKIQVLPPKFNLTIDALGKLKQNRKITLTVGNSLISKHYTFVNSEVKYELTSLDSDTSYVKYKDTLTGISKDILSKKSMQLKIIGSAVIELKDGKYRQDLIDSGLASEIPRYSNTAEKTIVIVVDQPPIADLAVPANILRNPADKDSNGYCQATENITNTSYSPDGDSIWKTICFRTYDSNNDGVFDNEQCQYSLDGTTWIAAGMTYAQAKASFNIYNVGTSNPSVYIHRTKDVGVVQYGMLTIELIPDSETIPEFLAPTDYLVDSTWQ